MSNAIVYSIFIIFTGSAIVSTFVLMTRQSLLVAYMLLGVLIGPYGFKLVSDSQLIREVSDIGIIFLLFLLGLNLHPQKLVKTLGGTSWVALISSFVFAAIGFIIALLFHYNVTESLIIGAAMMFSSTIIGLKLLPTTTLHHRHTGELMISILLLQDILAILILLLITAQGRGGLTAWDISLISLSLPILILISFVGERFLLHKLFARFDHVKEYVFLLSIGWCLSFAQLSGWMGLSEEIGAFIAGVAIAASPIALYIAENLKPLRDFFLVMFFFTIGASFNIQYLHTVLIPGALLALAMLIVKPLLFSKLLQQTKESKKESWEIGVRLGQASEFSLLLAYLAASGKMKLISDSANYLIQAATMLTFFVSSYWVVLKYPTPMAVTERMRKD